MPMQIGLDELLSMLLARVDGLAMDSENQKSRFNIMFRILYRKGIFSEADVLDAVREEHRILKELGMLEKMPEEEAIRSAADALMLAGGIDGKIGQIASVGEVGKRAGNADKVRTVPCRPQDVGLIEHGLQARQVGSGTADAGTLEYARKLFGGNGFAVAVFDHLLVLFFRLPFQAAFAFSGCPAYRRAA